MGSINTGLPDLMSVGGVRGIGSVILGGQRGKPALGLTGRVASLGRRSSQRDSGFTSSIGVEEDRLAMRWLDQRVPSLTMSFVKMFPVWGLLGTGSSRMGTFCPRRCLTMVECMLPLRVRVTSSLSM